MTPDYKYNEEALLKELKDYIDSTYSGHYSKSKIQTSEVIMDAGHGISFCLGNIMKYAQRYGNKGTPEDFRKDLMKILHYGMMLLYAHDLEYPVKKETSSFTIDPGAMTGNFIWDNKRRAYIPYNELAATSNTPYSPPISYDMPEYTSRDFLTTYPLDDHFE